LVTLKKKLWYRNDSFVETHSHNSVIVFGSFFCACLCLETMTVGTFRFSVDFQVWGTFADAMFFLWICLLILVVAITLAEPLVAFGTARLNPLRSRERLHGSYWINVHEM